MPKFFYTVLVATVLLWLGVLLLASSILPDLTIHIIAVIVGLYLALGMTFTLVSFVILNMRASLFMNRHLLYRRGLKYGFFISFCVTGLLALKTFELGNIVNYFLFTILCAMLYMQLKSGRK